MAQPISVDAAATSPLANLPMSGAQWRIVALCLALTAIDGFDVLAIGFASPGIASEWQLDPRTLGGVLAAELVGLALGSIVFGRLADRLGRKPIILIGLALMALTMGGVAFAGSVAAVGTLRLATGLGIGAVLVGTNALAAEVANDKRRETVISVMAIGFPLGAIVGGLIASLLLREGSWRDIFLFGSAVTGVGFLVALAGLKESVDFLLTQGSARSISRASLVLEQMGKPNLETTRRPPPTRQRGWRGLLQPSMLTPLLLVTSALFAHFMTAFFLLKWIPKITVDWGFHPSTAGFVLVWASIGGLIGCMALSVAMARGRALPIVLIALVISSVGVGLFGLTGASLELIAAGAFIANAGANAGTIGLFALAVKAFPPDVRGAGLGVAMGIGRGGAALGPFLGGQLFALGFSVVGVTASLALGSALAVGMVLLLATRREEQVARPTPTSG